MRSFRPPLGFYPWHFLLISVPIYVQFSLPCTSTFFGAFYLLLKLCKPVGRSVQAILVVYPALATYFCPFSATKSSELGPISPLRHEPTDSVQCSTACSERSSRPQKPPLLAFGALGITARPPLLSDLLPVHDLYCKLWTVTTNPCMAVVCVMKLFLAFIHRPRQRAVSQDSSFGSTSSKAQILSPQRVYISLSGPGPGVRVLTFG